MIELIAKLIVSHTCVGVLGFMLGCGFRQLASHGTKPPAARRANKPPVAVARRLRPREDKYRYQL